jgi:hypothetical protein
METRDLRAPPFTRWVELRVCASITVSFIALLFLGWLIPILVQLRTPRCREASIDMLRPPVRWNERRALACMDNLVQISASKQQWARGNHKSTNDVPTWVELRPPVELCLTNNWACPDGGTYTPGRVGEAPTCSVPGHSLLPAPLPRGSGQSRGQDG